MEVFMMRYAWAALCIAVLVLSGSAEGASLVTSKAANTEPSFTYDFTMDITNRIYNDSLLNTKSQDYNLMYEEVSCALYSVYGCPTCDTHTLYRGVTAMTFSNKDGSVLVMGTLAFNSSQTNAVVLKGLFEHALAGGTEINGLQFNPEFPIVVSRSSPGHHNAASPSFHQSPITSFLRYSFSFGLLFLLSYSF
ncbi:uncharacterized protein si:dkeyp-92c9.4 isoform X1 [Pangasianodon hypophthalmus]|uniref:uncharacterized protein si:dkeyp-92c9.4 isoform X1 n=1 Tax=Pangasianodon hypophthalmus TaxID=310915 RepID=UPI0023080EBF|nr:uncharacterized protein si:dkeyp-92c9.4 isoform X1 [Pangasianodon hypophthalmus]